MIKLFIISETVGILLFIIYTISIREYMEEPNKYINFFIMRLLELIISIYSPYIIFINLIIVICFLARGDTYGSI